MSDHDHRTLVPGCYRCDLSRDEERQSLIDQLADAEAERDALQAKLDAIDALHHKVIHMTNGQDFITCPTCAEDTYGAWPCDTARILHPEGDTHD